MKQLLELAREGDKEAEEELFQLLLARFVFYSGNWISDPETAADIAQEACVTVLRKYKTETFQTGFDAWAYGVLRMNIRHHFHKAGMSKKRRNDEETHIREALHASSPPDPEVERALAGCLKKILAVNPRYARALNLIHQGYKADDICERMGITRNHFYVTLNRARAMLKRCLELGEV